MIKQIVNRISENFCSQKELYDNMAVLAREQMELLENNQGVVNPAGLSEILAQRQALLNNIRQLSQENKALQEKARQELNVDKFVLTKIEGKVDGELFKTLKAVLKEMENILEYINETDKKTQYFMFKQLNHENSRPGSSNQQAQKAYQQVMNIDKNDRK